MRKLSRHMPKAPERKVIPAGACLSVVVLTALLTLANSTTAFLILIAFLGLIAIMNMADRRRLRRLAAGRAGESICTFARSFDRRSTDPWIIRAVYEEFRAYYDGALPVRATDRIENDLWMDWEDLDDMLKDIALRAGRSLDNGERNPLWNQISTVGDLVKFLSLQPRTRAV